MSQKRQATQRKPAQKKAGNRQGNSSNRPKFNGSLSGGQAKPLQQGALSFAPTSMSRSVRTGKPSIQTMRNGDCRIVHREYIQDITSSATSNTFSASSLSINPGQSAVFPWASKIAQNFESYRFRKLNFYYETEQASTLVGTVVQAVDYDSADSTPTSKQAMMQFRGSVRSAAWNASKHVSMLEDLSKKKTYFVRPSVQPANTDIREYDVGKYVIASQVTGTSVLLGEVYVEYDLELLTPIFNSSVGDCESFTISGGTGQAQNHFFGTDVAAVTNSAKETGQPLTVFTDVAAGTFTFQRAFTGLVTLELVGTGMTNFGTASAGTATIVQLGQSLDVGALKATGIWSVVAAPGQTFVFATSLMTTVASATMRTVAYPVGVLA